MASSQRFRRAVDMIEWVKNRHLAVLVPLALALGLGAVVTRSLSLTFPSYFGYAPFTGPLSYLFPVVLAMGLSWSLSRAPSWLEDRSARRVRICDVALALVSVVCCSVPALLVSASEGAVLARNGGSAVGLVLLAGRLLPRDTWAIPAAVWILAGGLSGRSFGRDAWWNWPIEPSGSPMALAWLLGLLGLGTVLHVLLARPAR